MTMMDIERKIPKLAVSLTKLLATIFSKKKKKKKTVISQYIEIWKCKIIRFYAM